MGVGIAELRESLSGYAAGFDAAVLSAAQAEEVVEQASRIENDRRHAQGAGRGPAGRDRLVAGRGRPLGGPPPGPAHGHDAWSRRRRRSTPPAAWGPCPRPRPPPAGVSCRPSRRRPSSTPPAPTRRRARPAGGGPTLAAGRAAGAVRPDQGRRPGRPRGPPPAHPPTPVAALLHRRRGRVAPPLPQQPRGRRPHHGRPRPDPGGDLPPGPGRGPPRAPDAYAADALAEMARRSVATTSVGRRGGSVPRPADDAADRLGAGPPGRRPARSAGGRRRPGPPKIIVRVDLGALLRGYPDRGRGVRDRRLRAGGGVGGAGHDRHRRPVPDRGGHPGPEAGGGGPSGAAAQRFAADGPAVALPELRQRGLQRPGPPRLRPPRRLGPQPLHRARPARPSLPPLPRPQDRQNWSLVEGRGKRALVPPEDPRHPRNASRNPRSRARRSE